VKTVYLGLGSNLEPRIDHINTARREIDNIPGVKIALASSLYLTAPWGKADQPDFINQVLRIETSLTALDLLHRLQDIEIKMGRQRFEKWGPRNIDLDILLYGDEIIDLGELKVPHPHLRERLFVLVPLAEIETELVFPGDGASIGEVLISVLDREGNEGIKKIN